MIDKKRKKTEIKDHNSENTLLNPEEYKISVDNSILKTINYKKNIEKIYDDMENKDDLINNYYNEYIKQSIKDY